MEVVVTIVDDIIVVGCGESLTDAHYDHDTAYLELLEHLSQDDLCLILLRLSIRHVLHHLWDMCSAQRGSSL